MAQWDYVRSSSVAAVFFAFDYTSKVWFMTDNSGGSYEYTGVDVWEYDQVADTITKVLTTSTLTNGSESFSECYGFAHFNSKLIMLNYYVDTGSNTTSLLVQEVNKTTYAVTTLHTVDNTIARYRFESARLFNNEDQLVVLRIGDQYYDPDPDAASTTYYSANGTSWTAGSIPSALRPTVVGSGHRYAYYQWLNESGDTIRDTWCVTGSGSSCTAETTVRWTGTAWTTDKAWGSSGYPHWWLDPEDGRFWTNFMSTLWNTGYTASVTPSGDYATFKVHNFPFMVGSYIYGGSADYKIKEWNPGTDAFTTWDDVQTTFPGPFTLAPDDNSILWRNEDGECYMYVYDSGAGTYYVMQRDEAIPHGEELRYTGIAADDATIYVTGNEGGTLKVWAFDINSLSLIRSLSLGAATYAQLDSRTYGVYPVVKPGENKLFVRGRDGNDVHVQYSDDYAVSLTDVDDGGWSAAKYAVALLHDPLVPDDVIVAFSDDDIYRSEDDAGTWVKVDDAAVTLREVARNTIDELQLILAGQSAGAGQLFFSPNLGVTSEDVSDAGIDIINHIESSL